MGMEPWLQVFTCDGNVFPTRLTKMFWLFFAFLFSVKKTASVLVLLASPHQFSFSLYHLLFTAVVQTVTSANKELPQKLSERKQKRKNQSFVSFS